MVLQDSLIELMKEKPIAKITIKELCEKADINRSTFYGHYADQYDLLRKIEDETLSWTKESIATLIGEKDKHGTLKVLEEICQCFLDNSMHLQVLMSERGDIDFPKELFTLVYQQCGMPSASEAHRELGMNGDGLIFVVNRSIGLIQHWLKNGVHKSAKEMAETIHHMAAPIR